MPIKFRCPACEQFLGISRSKAGSITDCPTCGRTLRVPNLDGTTSPLPAPKLNLDDSDLRQALGALASLEGDESDVVGDEFEPSASSAKSEILSSSRNDSPPIVAEPIAPPVAVVEVLPELVVLQDEPGPSLLMEEFPSGPHSLPRQTSSAGVPVRMVIALVIAVAILFSVMGFFLGRMSTPAVAPLQTDVPVQNPAPAQVADVAPNSDAEPSQFRGTLTYETDGNESRADRGARILILPVDNSPRTKLPSEGFRVGASEENQQFFGESVTAAGGRFLIADDQGQFQVNALRPGNYLVVLASRFQPRDDSEQLPPESLSVLQQYFDHPSQIIGKVASISREVEVVADLPIILDHEFVK